MTISYVCVIVCSPPVVGRNEHPLTFQGKNNHRATRCPMNSSWNWRRDGADKMEVSCWHELLVKLKNYCHLCTFNRCPQLWLKWLIRDFGPKQQVQYIFSFCTARTGSLVTHGFLPWCFLSPREQKDSPSGLGRVGGASGNSVSPQPSSPTTAYPPKAPKPSSPLLGRQSPKVPRKSPLPNRKAATANGHVDNPPAGNDGAGTPRWDTNL